MVENEMNLAKQLAENYLSATASNIREITKNLVPRLKEMAKFYDIDTSALQKMVSSYDKQAQREIRKLLSKMGRFKFKKGAYFFADASLAEKIKRLFTGPLNPNLHKELKSLEPVFRGLQIHSETWFSKNLEKVLAKSNYDFDKQGAFLSLLHDIRLLSSTVHGGGNFNFSQELLHLKHEAKYGKGTQKPRRVDIKDPVNHPEMVKVFATVYATCVKELKLFQVANQKALEALVMVVQKVGKDHPYLDVNPLLLEIHTAMKDDAAELQRTIKLLQVTPKTAGLLDNFLKWNPTFIAAKLLAKATKLLWQIYRKPKDPDAYAAVKSISKAWDLASPGWQSFSYEHAGLYDDSLMLLTRALSKLTGDSLEESKWMLEGGNSPLMHPLHDLSGLYHRHGRYAGFSTWDLEQQAKSGPGKTAKTANQQAIRAVLVGTRVK